MHRGGRHDAGVDQRLRAFLAFDEHHGVGRGYAGHSGLGSGGAIF